MFIKTDDQNNIITYPYSLDQFREENRNRSLPKFLNNRFLATQNVYPVYASEKPVYDEINENIRLDIENPYLDTDGEWRYSWIVTAKPPDQIQQEFEKRKSDFNSEINAARDDAIYSTKMIPVNTSTTVPVDIRKDQPDIQNISGLVQAATVQTLNNDDTVIEFRGADDTVYELTPQETIIMGTSVLKESSRIYKKSWEYKEQLKTVTTVEEINAIVLNFDP